MCHSERTDVSEESPAFLYLRIVLKADPYTEHNRKVLRV